MNEKKFLLAITFLLVIAIGCSDRKRANLASIDIDGVNYNVKNGGVGYDVVNNKVDYSSGQQFMVEMTVSNNTNENLIFDSTSFLLIGKSGQEISLPIDNDVIGIANQAFYNTPISPRATEECILMFKIKEAGKYKLKITSPMSKTQEIITL